MCFICSWNQKYIHANTVNKSWLSYIFLCFVSQIQLQVVVACIQSCASHCLWYTEICISVHCDLLLSWLSFLSHSVYISSLSCPVCCPSTSVLMLPQVPPPPLVYDHWEQRQKIFQHSEPNFVTVDATFLLSYESLRWDFLHLILQTLGG